MYIQEINISSAFCLDCYDGSSVYMGTLAINENEFECQPWVSNFPHAHKHHTDSMFPDGSVAAAKNYCRAPDDDVLPWCYTTDPDERWGYCHIPRCKGKAFLRLNTRSSLFSYVNYSTLVYTFLRPVTICMVLRS